MFKNRAHAGEILAQRLSKYKNDPDAVVVAIPRGGVVPGVVVANQLQLPLELILAKKIGHPVNKEVAIGAAGPEHYFLSPEFDRNDPYIREELQRVRKKLETYNQLFRNGKPQASFTGKKVIIVDDGIATGSTYRMVIELLRMEHPKKIIAAIPVSPPDTLHIIESMVDETICLETPDPFYAVGEHYETFGQVESDEVVRLLHL